MTQERIVTTHIFPPIPDRNFDWMAYLENDAEKPWMHGYGPTEQDAIEDLKRLIQERAEYEEELN